MMLKKITILFFVVFIFIVSVSLFCKYYAQPNLHRLKLAYETIGKSFAQVQKEYSNKDCNIFSSEEKINGFDGLVTAYCKPKANDFNNRKDFLCAVGLNCSCPAGRSKTDDCESSSLKWSSCIDFNDQKIAYCDQTADQNAPGAGQVAADWNCFKPGTTVLINEQKYTVTDKGSAIKGRRFDIWFDNCQDSEKKTGIYNIKIK